LIFNDIVLKDFLSLFKILKSASEAKTEKTINSWYSLVVTQPTTNQPAHGLSIAERTGSPVFHVLWSIVTASVF
jgi:hypothetical protein